MEFVKVEETMFVKQHSEDVFEFVEYGDMNEDSKVQLFFVRNTTLAFSDLTEAEVEEVIKPYYSSLEQLKLAHGEDYKEVVLKYYFQELSSNSVAQYVGNKRIQIVNSIFNMNAETCLQVLEAMGLTFDVLNNERESIPEEKEYVANIVYQSGEYRSVPLRNVSCRREVIAHLLEKDIYLDEMVSITIIERD